MTPRVAVSTPPEGCRPIVSPAPAREAPGDATRKWCCVGAIDREACLFCRFSRPLQNRFYLHTGAIATLHSAVPLLKEQVLEVEGSAITAIAFPDEGAQKRFGKMFGKLPQVLPRGCTTLFAKQAWNSYWVLWPLGDFVAFGPPRSVARADGQAASRALADPAAAAAQLLLRCLCLVRKLEPAAQGDTQSSCQYR